MRFQYLVAFLCLATILAGCVNINPTYTMPPVNVGYNRYVTNTNAVPESPRGSTYASGKLTAWRGIPYALPKE